MFGAGGGVDVGVWGGQAGLDKIPTFSETHRCMAPLWITPPPIRGKADLFHIFFNLAQKAKRGGEGLNRKVSAQ